VKPAPEKEKIMKRGILAAVVVMALLATLGASVAFNYAYHAGLVEGLAEAGKLPTPAAAPYPYYGHYWHGPFVFGGPFLGLLFIFLVFGLLRRAMWGGYGYWGHMHGACGGVPPRFEEWHRRAHESMGPDVTKV
jgi:hypothetical protein